jgi:Uma2 family endonuclease
MATAAESLLTVEEFSRRPDSGYPEELVKGRIVTMTLPKPFHGFVCYNVCLVIGSYLKAHPLGYLVSNDSGVVTERGPDTVRGPDVAFYSFNRVPKGSLPRRRHLDVVPDLLFEVLSPDDRWRDVLGKVLEYLNAGVSAVCVLDPERRTLHLDEGDQPVRILSEDDELTLPSILGEFRAKVREFFD